MEMSVSVQVTVHTAGGRVFGPYSITLTTLNAPTSLTEYEKEGLRCAREDGLSDADAAGCTFRVEFPKDQGTGVASDAD